MKKTALLMVFLMILLFSTVVVAKDDIALFRDTTSSFPSVGQWYISYAGPNSDPNSGLNNTINTSALLGAYLDTPLLGDINGDSVDDVVLVSEFSGATDPNEDASVWRAYLTKRDINGDGQVASGGASSMHIPRFWKDKSWYYDLDDPDYDPEGRPVYSLLADVNGDGKGDAIRIETGKAYNYNWWAIHSSETTIGGLGGANGSSSIVWGYSGDIPVTGDFNGDGYFDAAVVRDSGGYYYWYVALSDANGLSVDSTTSASNSFGGTGDIPLIGDINADGRDDAVVFRPNTGAWYGTYADADGTIDGLDYVDMTAASPWGNLGGSGDIPLLADFNEDGIDDIGVFRPSTGEWFFLLDDGATGIGDGTVITAMFGGWGDAPLIGEFNGLPGKPADLDDSGIVDLGDLADLAKYWMNVVEP